MKKARKIMSGLLCSAMVFCSVPVFAAQGTGAPNPAELPDVTVEYNGEAVEFTDAEPCIKNSRTYVPFRAVFEAMGASSIEYDASSKTVTAVRDGATVKMQVGKSEIQVTKDGKTTNQKIDAATFIKNSRTYVPARFAAQALGCQVGWDSQLRTVVIWDGDKLMEGTKGQFSLMKKYMEYSDQLVKKYPAYTGSFDLDMTVQDGAQPLRLKGSYDMKGKVADMKSIVNSSVKLDLRDIEKYLKAQPDWNSESQKS